MADVRLIYDGERQLKPLVEAALANELRLTEAGLKQTENRVSEFEKRHRMSSQEFIARYENDEIAETTDFAEWIGELRLSQRLREKIETLRDIRFEI